MKRIRCGALVEIDGGFALMHRLDVKKSIEHPERPFGEYYVFPGGGLEENESLEEAAKREVFEEFGIIIEIERKLFYRKINDELEEHIFLGKYISGEFGTGSGPEFSNDPKYIDRGKYIPEIVKKEEIKNINLFPTQFKTELLEYMKK